MSDESIRYGWQSDFAEFGETSPNVIREHLSAFVTDASKEQQRAWADSIPPLQGEISKSIVTNELARDYSAILEYMLPMESRRPDVILLVGGSVMIVELKGKTYPSQADLDQVAAYARDLRNYHRECAGRDVHPVLVPTRARGDLGMQDGVRIAGPDVIHALVGRLTATEPLPRISREAFLSETAYCPLPTLVQAARELMFSGTLRTIDRARSATKPALDEISRIVHQAHLTKSRHLILLTGVPGAGKTLVGLQTVHARYLDDLAIARENGKPSTPAVFLSGNGPLVEVLQYEMRSSGGDGKTFVRGVKEYVKRYSAKRSLIPPEHVLVFDEAQRAYDMEKMRASHDSPHARSEPEEFVSFADRIPEWCVVIGLIGSGQEIHVGEEGGVGQWRDAVEASSLRRDWTIHAPVALAPVFTGSTVVFEARPTLNLDQELRFHQVKDLHGFVAGLLGDDSVADLSIRAARLNREGLNLRVTRDLAVAKTYLRERYTADPQARFGLIASSKDKSLPRFGVMNDFQSTKRVKFGPWYGDPENAYGSQSCRLMDACVTEFGAQGLELDAALLAWGTDMRRVGGRWDNSLSGKYKKGSSVKDPFQLRINAYRVLLTRGRDATIVFVPPIEEMDETFAYLVDAGFTLLT
ncbi:MAG: DNA/RNA helicase domain-containing protein [Gemmatimonadaceae bacterium]|nr:DNA/RNA helicase domain-containing protein [Gemmatimonadaceae bacterium]